MRKPAKGGQSFTGALQLCEFCLGHFGEIQQHRRKKKSCGAAYASAIELVLLGPPELPLPQSPAQKYAFSDGLSSPLPLGGCSIVGGSTDFSDGPEMPPARASSPAEAPVANAVDVPQDSVVIDWFLKGDSMSLYGTSMADGSGRPDSLYTVPAPRVKTVFYDPRAGWPLNSDGSRKSGPLPSVKPGLKMHETKGAAEYRDVFASKPERDLFTWLDGPRTGKKAADRLLRIVHEAVEQAAETGDPAKVLNVRSISDAEMKLHGIEVADSAGDWQELKITFDGHEDSTVSFLFRDSWAVFKAWFARFGDEIMLGPTIRYSHTGEKMIDELSDTLFWFLAQVSFCEHLASHCCVLTSAGFSGQSTAGGRLSYDHHRLGQDNSRSVGKTGWVSFLHAFWKRVQALFEQALERSHSLNRVVSYRDLQR